MADEDGWFRMMCVHCDRGIYLKRASEVELVNLRDGRQGELRGYWHG